MLVIIQQTISEVQMTKEELKPIDTGKYKITETGQVLKMTKDEMKNRISMALKDPLLQQGFEIICKENAELKAQKQLGDTVMQKQKDKADLVWKLKIANEQKATQLVKAKTIIRNCLNLRPSVMTEESVRAIIREAEQFLKE